jgi:peptide-methionine (R)-S-oxide reductase
MAGKAYSVTHSDAEWRQILTPEQYDVMRAHGTEAPGSCALLFEKRRGRFSCAAMWSAAIRINVEVRKQNRLAQLQRSIKGAVETSTDRTLGMVRTEVHCANCGSHLGHVFDDGPPPTHLRYCINGIAMNFVPD